jgi:hypothetical protein
MPPHVDFNRLNISRGLSLTEGVLYRGTDGMQIGSYRPRQQARLAPRTIQGKACRPNLEMIYISDMYSKRGNLTKGEVECME